MCKVQVDVAGMKNLYTHARKIGTMDNWISLAIEWMEKAEAHFAKQDTEIAVLKGQLDKFEHNICPTCGTHWGYDDKYQGDLIEKLREENRKLKDEIELMGMEVKESGDVEIKMPKYWDFVREKADKMLVERIDEYRKALGDIKRKLSHHSSGYALEVSKIADKALEVTNGPHG